MQKITRMHWHYEASLGQDFCPAPADRSGAADKQQATRRHFWEDNVTDRQRVSAASPSFLAGVAAAALAALMLIAAPARAADPIKIGFSMALTGGLASGGKVMLITLKMWEEDVNARGGRSEERRVGKEGG